MQGAVPLLRFPAQKLIARIAPTAELRLPPPPLLPSFLLDSAHLSTMIAYSQNPRVPEQMRARLSGNGYQFATGAEYKRILW